MKKLASLALYIAYLVIVLTRPLWINSAENSFNIIFPLIINTAAIVLCTLIIIIRPHLVELVYTIKNVLFHVTFIVVSLILFTWIVCNTGNINYLLIALLTENIFNFVVLIAKKHNI